PLNLSIFSAFKRYHSYKTYIISRLSLQHIPRLEWIKLLSCAREKAILKKNILSK
ncbi:hypothetical protein BU23DRAFT_448531, partial [Bimuria novae-zelandiae CBS 107.79]